jgi:hypothetical protein
LLQGSYNNIGCDDDDDDEEEVDSDDNIRGGSRISS